jgi:dTDP-4-amino-4,6-dideoxygalactose transaminase
MQVPFLDLKTHTHALADHLKAAIGAVVDEAQFVLGPAVTHFETMFADYLGARHCIGLNNGTSALHMALLACDVGPGDEVITTPATWISTSWAISYVGATPVFVDVEPDTFGLDAAQVERAITPRTKAILPVHLYGQAASLRPLLDLAQRHSLSLIEDAAQAHGARYEGRCVGTLGRAGCFSFYPGKNLGAAGEGGAVVTNDDRLAERARRLRDHAQASRHHHVEVGFNTRMEGIQGAVLATKLPYLERWNMARTWHAALYRELLADVPGLILPTAVRREGHVWHLFVVQLEHHDREAVRAALAERGVATAIHYPTPVPFQPAYAHLGYRRGQFPVTEQLMSRCLSLPMYPEMTREQVEHVADSVREVLARRALVSEAVRS